MAVAVKTVGQEFVILISIFAVLHFSTLCSAQSGVRGPPQAKEKEIKIIAKVRENVKIVCPIQGHPTPMFEWRKNEDKIDFMWERHIANPTKRWLKIKDVTQDDTGIYHCKGINGFGSEEVRVQLIVVDPRNLPKGLNGEEVAPPVFTRETKIATKSFSLKPGDTFKVSCEALGSPQPEIFWFKDGQHIDNNVHYQRGKSTLEFNIMGTADSGTYMCKISNLFGDKTLNFSLDVDQTGAPSAIVTEAGPNNKTVFEGEEAALQCKVKSIDQPPQIKWLKKLEPSEQDDLNTLKVGQERYRILNTNNFIQMGDEYLNRLVIDNAEIEDSGLYICFVTNSGFNPLTYKSMVLKVERRRPELDIINNIPNNKDVSNDDHPWYLWILVVSLSAIVFALLAALSFCVCCKRDGPKDHSETQSSTGACSDVERPFMPQTNPQLNSYYQKNNNKLLNKPLPPTPMTLAQWSSAIHPQTSPKYSADSGFNDHDNSKELNQYEVPYAHLLRTYRPSAPTEDIYFTQEAFMQPQNSIVSGYLPPQRLCNQPRYYTEYETQ